MMNKENSTFVAARNNMAALAVILMCAILVPVVSYSLMNHPPEYDELLHILAARSMAETGQPAIADGFYTRAVLFTKLISHTTGLHSDELVAARIPALISTVLLAALIGFWTTKKVGVLAGLTAGIILIITSPTINLTVIVRFYTLHALVVTLLIILLYETSGKLNNIKFSSISLILSALLIWAAFQLHDISKITVGATVIGLIFLALFRYRHTYTPFISKRPLLSLALLAVLTAVVLTGIWTSGVLDLLRQSTPVWSELRANHFGFYLASLGTQMPLIWPLFPVMAICAFLYNQRLAGYLITIAVVAFIANSIASQKATRYIFHFYPLVCILWGIGFQYLVLLVSSAFAKKTRFPHSVCVLLILFVASTCIVSTQEFRRALKLMLGRPLVNDVVRLNDESDWIAAKPAIDPLLPDIDTIIASSGFKSLYAFGRYDYEIHATVVAETDTKEEFGVDPRTGRRVISTAESVESIISAPGKELFVIDERMLNTRYGANPQAVQVISDRCTSVEVPESSKIVVWQC